VGGVGVIGTTGGGRGYAEGVGSQPTYAPSAGGSGGGDFGGGGAGAAVGGGELGNSGGIHSSGDSYEAGGGGGACRPGGNSTGTGVPGVGGAGTNLTFSGASVTYATGGKGGWRTTAYTGANGTANRGNGGEGSGGGNGGTGGNGGSGIVIVRYDTGAARIQNRTVSNVATNAATLNGWLDSVGLSATAVSVRYGTDNGAVSGAFAFTNWWNTGDWSANSYPATNITGLTQDRTYYYTFTASNAAGNVVALLPTNFMSFITGEVTVETTGDNAQFAGGNGQFTISRPATCVSEPLTVYYSMSGSASNGVVGDYVGTNEQALPGSVVINAGATSATVSFRVKADGDTTNEHAVLTLLSGYNYPIGATSYATVTILPGTPGGGLVTTGGTLTRYRENGTNFIARIFTNSAVLAVSSNGANLAMDYLIVAGGGGGGGGQQGGGGGAGGVRRGSTNLTAGEYTITIGAGGVGSRWSGANEGSNGVPSSIVGTGVSINTTGGGRGASEGPTYAPASGGSGGGGGHGGSTTGAASNKGAGELGNSGGSSTDPAGYPCGGGGGAGGPGGAATVANTPGVGGAGTNLTFSGTSVAYATGGGGGYRAGSGNNGVNGTANTGNGGSGGGNGLGTGIGGNGGSGIVIVRYVDTGDFNASVAATTATAQWPLQTGAFTITRPADANTNYSASVSYTLSGTATNGVDYSANAVANGAIGYPSPTPQALSGLATFDVGVTSIVVNVYPLYNPPFSAKTATLTLNVAGSPAATINFQAWSPAGAVSASGGVATNYYVGTTNWAALIFTNSAAPATLTVTAGGAVEYLLVAGGGGGGGGWNGGGGGAGGVRLGSVTLPAGAYTVTVGAGGPGANRLGAQINGSNGLPSVISAAVGVVSATGGGHGHSEIFYDARDGVGNGGSGGGSGGTAAGGGELGNNGGTGSQDWTGGGGGARTVGGTGSTSNQGLGGGGTNLTFSGVSVTYAAGGNGCAGRNGVDGANALANTGNGGSGGGGGTSIKGGNGGDGIVVVRYIIPPPPKGTVILLR